MTAPDDFLKRSPIAAEAVRNGASWFNWRDRALIAHFGDPEHERSMAQRLGVVDLCPLPRLGVKGSATQDWLKSRGVSAVPDAANRHLVQPDGGICALLGPREALLLSPLSSPQGVAGAVGAAQETPDAPCRCTTLELELPAPGVFGILRGDSHGEFLLCGQHSQTLLARMCAIDFSDWPDDHTAQTSVARLSAIVLPCPSPSPRVDGTSYRILCPAAAALYLWECLRDAAQEFDGGPIGFAGLDDGEIPRES